MNTTKSKELIKKYREFILSFLFALSSKSMGLFCGQELEIDATNQSNYLKFAIQ